MSIYKSIRYCLTSLVALCALSTGAVGQADQIVDSQSKGEAPGLSGCDLEKGPYLQPIDQSGAKEYSGLQAVPGDDLYFCLSIDEQGAVLADSIKILSGNWSGLQIPRAFSSYIEGWRFEPLIVDGKAQPQHNVIVGVSYRAITENGICHVDFEEPMTRVEPVGPFRCRPLAIHGFTTLLHTVDANGNVLRDSMKVIQAEPSAIFNRVSMRALRKWKYHPKIEDGNAVQRDCVIAHFEYFLEGQ